MSVKADLTAPFEYVGWILADHEEVEEQVVQGLNPHCPMRYCHDSQTHGISQEADWR